MGKPVLTRSALVGVVATAIDLATLALLIDVLGVAPVAANIPALIVGVAAQFVGNKYYAFNDRSRDLARQGARFLAVEMGALALNALTFHLVVTLTPAAPLAARLVSSSLVYFGFSYPLWGRIFVGGRS